jgi:hypothetical protein
MKTEFRFEDIVLNKSQSLQTKEEFVWFIYHSHSYIKFNKWVVLQAAILQYKMENEKLYSWLLCYSLHSSNHFGGPWYWDLQLLCALVSINDVGFYWFIQIQKYSSVIFSATRIVCAFEWMCMSDRERCAHKLM